MHRNIHEWFNQKNADIKLLYLKPEDTVNSMKLKSIYFILILHFSNQKKEMEGW